MTAPRIADPLDAALAYARRGWRVVPIKPGEKHPSLNEWQKVATTDEPLIRDWWGRWADFGVGIATGPESAIFVLDVDVSAGKAGDETLADLIAEHGALPDTVEVITGSGGRHLYFAYPVGAEITNASAGALGPGLDIRGAGGQVLAPPSLHPNGRRYEWEASGDPELVDVADAPAWLVDLLTTAPDPAKAQRHRAERPDGDLPGDRFAAAVSWPELLEADGAHYLGTRTDRRSGASYELWARPGVNHTSATLYYGGSDVLKVFSPNWGGIDPATGGFWQLDEGATYTRFGYYAARHHGGDHAAAASELRKHYGGGDSGIEAWLSEVLASQPAASAAIDTDDQADDEWDDPAPLHAPDPAPFPLDVLPEWMAAHCAAVADQMQVPVDLCAQVALGAWSAACAGHVMVAITASWRSDVNVYFATALHSGGGKSPVTNAFTRPLFQLEEAVMANAASDIARATAERKVYERQKAEAEKSGDVDRMQLAILALESHTVPRPPRLVGDDSTPERLTELVAEQGGRFAVISSEGAVFDIASGMYASAGRKTNLDIYLKGWSGDRVIVDRKGSGDRAGTQLVIQRAVLTVAITVQPAALSELRKHPELAGRGFTARFMYSVPRDLLGRRQLRRVVEVDATDSAKVYDETFSALASRMVGWEANLVHLHPDSLDAFLDWRQGHEEHLSEGGSLERLAEWVAKLHGTVPRVAALLHLADNNRVGDAVSPATMVRALRLGDYWLSHALVVADIWSLDDTLEGARRALQRLVAKGMDAFSERDAWIANRSAAYPAMGDFRPVLALLEEYGWIRKVLAECEPSRAGRKPSPRYVLHPHAKRLLGQSSARRARDSVTANKELYTLYVSPLTHEDLTHNAQSPEPGANGVSPPETGVEGAAAVTSWLLADDDEASS